MSAKTLMFVYLVVTLAVSAAVRLEWDASPTSEEVTHYNIYAATEIIGPWQLVTNTATTNWTIEPSGQRRFFRVTAVNLWGESGPSAVTNTPDAAGNVSRLKIVK